MGRFDSVRAINISHKNFDKQHNDQVFQAKSLDCDGSVYCIFNGVLYQEVDNSGEPKCQHHDYAIETGYSGELNIYMDITENRVTCWVEYDLVFDSGKIIDVVKYDISVMHDDRDISSYRPSKPRNLVEVTISVRNCDRETQDQFAARVDNQMLDALRDIIGEPTATIYYPDKRISEPRYFGGGVYPRMATIASVVQTREAFDVTANGKINVTAPNGDQITLLLEDMRLLK